MGKEALLYNGPAYTGFDATIIGHPFFDTSAVRDGSVLYDGIWYHHVPLTYDILHDQLVLLNPATNYICPDPEKVGEFLFSGHTFIQTPKGYYEILCSGVMTLEARRIKEIETHSSVQDYTRTVIENDRYYLVKGGVYQRLSGVKALLSQMGDKKSKVRQYLRKSKIRPRKQKELAMVKAVEYYNQLSP